MRIEQYLVAAWASQLSDKLIKDAIQSLEAMDSQEMLSGDSGLKNVWEEICVQVQDEQSFFWETYVETMEGLLAGHVEMLDADARLALWTLTDSGRDYIDDHQADDEAGLDIPVDADEIVSMLMDGLLSVASGPYCPATAWTSLDQPELGRRRADECVATCIAVLVSIQPRGNSHGCNVPPTRCRAHRCRNRHRDETSGRQKAEAIPMPHGPYGMGGQHTSGRPNQAYSF